MPQVSCPSCKRKGTYSEKHKQCSACGLGYEAVVVTPGVTPAGETFEVVTPVTPSVTEKAESVTQDVTNDTKAVTFHDCPDCKARHRIQRHESNAARQKAYRKRTQEAK